MAASERHSFIQCFSFIQFYSMFQEKKFKGVFTLILRISFIFEIFQISLAIKKSLKFNLFFISKFKFDRVHGKMFNNTDLKVIQIDYIKDTKQS